MFLTNRNIFYGISLDHKQTHEFVLVKIGKNGPQSAFECGSILAVIRLTAVKYSRVFGNSKF